MPQWNHDGELMGGVASVPLSGPEITVRQQRSREEELG